MTTIFRKAQIDKEKLREIILKNPQSLFSGLSFIDLQLSTDDGGSIDFLGVDTNGRMVIVNFDRQSNDQMLMEILSQLQWLKKNEGLIKRLFFSENVDFGQAPLMILVCPDFSRKLKSAIKQLTDKDIKLLKFNYIVSKDDDAIIFDEVFSNIDTSEVVAVKAAPEKIQESLKVDRSSLIKQQPIAEKIISEKIKEDIEIEEYIDLEEKIEGKAPVFDAITLTPEELAEFMDFEITAEQA